MPERGRLGLSDTHKFDIIIRGKTIQSRVQAATLGIAARAIALGMVRCWMPIPHPAFETRSEVFAVAGSQLLSAHDWRSPP
jgi:hypothetical protein